MQTNRWNQRVMRMEKIRNRIGQIEMIGLVIVVILIVIGLLFYVRFGVLRDEPIRQDTVVNNARLINLMGALFNFNICESTQLQEAMVACYNDKEICDKTDSCTFVKDKVEEILQSSGLRLKNESYSISIGKGDNPKFLLDECNNIGILVSTTIIDSNRDHYNSYFRTC